MGSIFSKKAKSRITDQDMAVLNLKKQRDQLKQYQKRINGQLEKDRDIARRLLKEGKKERAKLMLRKKKFQEGLLEKTDGQLDNLERLVADIEFSTVQQQVLDGLKEGKDALEKANNMFSIEEIEDILADTEEAVEKQREIDQLLSGQLSQVDEDDVEAELASLLATDVVPELPNVPADNLEPEDNLELPEVPSQEPVKESKKVAVEAS